MTAMLFMWNPAFTLDRNKSSPAGSVRYGPIHMPTFSYKVSIEVVDAPRTGRHGEIALAVSQRMNRTEMLLCCV